MILTCPECNTQFSVDGAAIWPQGRKVRCTNCKHVWLQKPVEEDEGSQIDEDFDSMLSRTDDEPYDQSDDIPESLKRPVDSDADLKIVQNSGQTQRIGALAAGACLGAAFWVVLAMFAMGQADKIISIWPPSAQLFNLAGVQYTLNGESLAFERFETQLSKLDSGSAALSLQGRIINLSSVSQAVPSIEVAVLDQENRVITQKRVQVESDTIGAEGEVFYTLEGLDLTSDQYQISEYVRTRFVVGGL